MIPGLGRSTGGGWHGNPLQYSCLENHHGQKCLVGYSPWGCKESDTTEQLSTRIQFSSVTQSYSTLCNPVKRSTPRHQLLELTQTHLHWVGDAIQPSHPLSSPPLALDLSQHQDLFKWVMFFSAGGQSIGASASASVLPMNIQGWYTALYSAQVLHYFKVKIFWKLT